MELWAGNRDAGALQSARRKLSAPIGAARLRILRPQRLQTNPGGDFSFTRIVWMPRNWTAGLARAEDRRGWSDCCRRCLEERGWAEKMAPAGSPMPANY